MIALNLFVFFSLIPMRVPAQAADTVKPAIGTALHEASDFAKAKKWVR